MIKERLSSDNVKRLLHVLCSQDTSSKWGAFVKCQKKAFDPLEWVYLLKLKKRFKFEESS